MLDEKFLPPHRTTHLLMCFDYAHLPLLAKFISVWRKRSVFNVNQRVLQRFPMPPKIRGQTGPSVLMQAKAVVIQDSIT